jgi:hypothetical protein
VTRHFYWLATLMKMLPRSLVKLLIRDVSDQLELKEASSVHGLVKTS